MLMLACTTEPISENNGAGETDQPLRTLVILAGDPHLILSTEKVAHTYLQFQGI